MPMDTIILLNRLVKYINFSTGLSQIHCQNTLQYMNIQLKYLRTCCHNIIISSCLKYCLSLTYIGHKVRIENYAQEPNVIRKATSLKMEMLRSDLRHLHTKKFQLERERGYQYLNLQRLRDNDISQYILLNMRTIFKQEAQKIHERHTKKWTHIGKTVYPASLTDYMNCDYRPKFPFDRPKVKQSTHNCTENSNKHGTVTDNSEQNIPSNVSKLLEKGPNFRVPHKFNDKFWDKINSDFEAFFYRLRWHTNIGDNDNDYIHIPYDRNKCTLPKSLDEIKEFQLQKFFVECKEVISSEVEIMKNKPFYKKIKNDSQRAKNFLKSNNLTCIQSDKTNRLIVCEREKINKKLQDILCDKNTYEQKSKSSCKNIETQANMIIKKSLKNSSLTEKKYNAEKLLSCNSKPAKFFGFVKDHKEVEDGLHPLRPIASVHNTPVDKIDWVLSKILSQILRFIPAHLESSEQLIDILKSTDLSNMDNPIFISLDIVKLYPSIPITKGIEENIAVLKKHYHEIDNYNIDLHDIENMLKFVCYNYEIMHQDICYRQIKGVPMGCRFAPAFSIIFMHSLEQEAMKKLHLTPFVYKRFIDDIILGPIEDDPKIVHHITDTFNSINSDIRFTVEYNSAHVGLSFLDIKIFTENKKLEYTWYQKECHSGTTLNKGSFIPQHMKQNFVNSRQTYIKEHCSSEALYKESIIQFKHVLEKNGYGNISRRNKPKTKIKRKKKPEKQINLEIPFVSDRCDKKLKQIINKFDLPCRLVSKANKNLASFLDLRHPASDDNCVCTICKQIRSNSTGETFNSCTDRYVVYKYTCKICNQIYIGKTARPFKTRHQEHARSIKNKSKVSALSEHAQKHDEIDRNINLFNISFLKKENNSRDTTVAECKYIENLKPQINRKQELTSYPLITDKFSDLNTIHLWSSGHCLSSP